MGLPDSVEIIRSKIAVLAIETNSTQRQLAAALDLSQTTTRYHLLALVKDQALLSTKRPYGKGIHWERYRLIYDITDGNRMMGGQTLIKRQQHMARVHNAQFTIDIQNLPETWETMLQWDRTWQAKGARNFLKRFPTAAGVGAITIHSGKRVTVSVEDFLVGWAEAREAESIAAGLAIQVANQAQRALPGLRLGLPYMQRKIEFAIIQPASLKGKHIPKTFLAPGVWVDSSPGPKDPELETDIPDYLVALASLPQRVQTIEALIIPLSQVPTQLNRLEAIAVETRDGVRLLVTTQETVIGHVKRMADGMEHLALSMNDLVKLFTGAMEATQPPNEPKGVPPGYG